MEEEEDEKEKPDGKESSSVSARAGYYIETPDQ
jgi:hypothetical protein